MLKRYRSLLQQGQLAARLSATLSGMPDVSHFPEMTPALRESVATSEHVAIGRITLFGGEVHEVISVDRAFLAAALRDAIAWRHETEGPGKPADVADYEAALAVIGGV